MPLTFTGSTATRGTDYTLAGAAGTGLAYTNLNAGTATVKFTGPSETVATITLTTVDDGIEDSDETVDIALGTLSDNAVLFGVGGVSGTGDPAVVTITDVVVAGVTITESGEATAVFEDGTVTDTYTVVLDSAPSASVTVECDGAGWSGCGRP